MHRVIFGSMTADPFARAGVVLLRPKSPGNVGSVARAMKNMGFGRLVLADPMSYDDPAWFDHEAGRMAWNATDLLRRLHRAASLDEALAPFTFVLGTTSSPPPGFRTLEPAEAAREIARLLRSDPAASAALLFGQEDIGLTRDHLARCQAIGVVPSSAEYPSLNLAQSVLIFLYELRRALGPAHDTAADPSPSPSPDPRPSQEALEAFYGRLETALDAIGYLQGSSRAHMMREMRRLFNRALLSGREVAILEGVAHQILLAARRVPREGD